jgi:hypothetical protein
MRGNSRDLDHAKKTRLPWALTLRTTLLAIRARRLPRIGRCGRPHPFLAPVVKCLIHRTSRLRSKIH